MRIATYNVNSIRSRMDAVLQWLAEYRPDILCLQETKVQDVEFPELPLREAGYHLQFRGMKSYNGVAILSRSPPDAVTAGFDDGGPADEPRLLCARWGDLSVVNTYVPQGRAIDHEMFRYKIEWFRRLRAYFDRNFRPSEALVWVGDLNVAAQPIDVYNPEQRAQHVCYHADAREALAFCRAWGFEDVFRKFHPEGGHYTFFDYRTADSLARGWGWRIDYILASPAMAERATQCTIDLEPRKQPKASDHTVMYADFR
ncbi:MAG TPA: exodeoxyribonuclease III [Kiritimatiellia bacterium]|nr:exodeoxyribonuclease III [Kiritimatiellia bacterium]HMP00005.1 exodeoxyribonuclease III [Kiritimatiellia bacterium]HMP98063.1 exodeoxyribonuclease III [Kiritimatiellia bacterium]